MSCLICSMVESRNKQKKNGSIERDSDSSDEEHKDSRLRLMDSSLTLETRTTIIQRKKAAVIKTPFISHVSNPDAYYYSVMLLYLPFRIEEDLLGKRKNAGQCYREIFNLNQ